MTRWSLLFWTNCAEPIRPLLNFLQWIKSIHIIWQSKGDFLLHSALSFHCIVHWERLCKSFLKLKHVVSSAVHQGNSIITRRLTESRKILKFLGRHRSRFYWCAGTSTMFTGWAFGEVLKRMWHLKTEIITYFIMKDLFWLLIRNVEQQMNL